MACLALFAAGCGEDKNEAAREQVQQENQQQAEAAIEKAGESVKQSAKASPEVREAQRKLAAKAKKQKADAIKEARTIPPEGRSDVRCGAYLITSELNPVGHNCDEAKKLVKAGGNKWYVLAGGNGEKVAGYTCRQVGAPGEKIKIHCFDRRGTIGFVLKDTGK